VIKREKRLLNGRSSKGMPVNVIAHSMGGLIVRVAHGVASPSANDDRQWQQMDPDSGFMDRLHWHASGDHPPHHTDRGWSPLKTAFQAATKVGDGLPK
jgi:hypothetical protein